MKALFKKELGMYFGTYNAYAFAFIFLIINALFLWFLDTNYNIFNIGHANLKSFFQISPWLWMFLIPALTMRSFAEENTLGTLQWLFSKPIHLTSIIGAKFWALALVILFCLIPTLVFVYSVSQLAIPVGNIDLGIIQSGYLGLLLLSFAFIAIGLWTSSTTKNVVYAYLIALFINFIFLFGLEKIASFESFGTLDFFIKKLGFENHFRPFVNGLVDTRDIFYFISIILTFSLLTYLSLKKQK